MSQIIVHKAKTCVTIRTVVIPSVSWATSQYSSFIKGFKLTVKHVCHLNELTDEQLNKLLNNIVDMENLYISISRQDDMDIKKVNL